LWANHPVHPDNRPANLPSKLVDSIRINEQYRICFVWLESDPDEVEIVDYH
jgi:plasmid maintenance system killer protein